MAKNVEKEINQITVETLEGLLKEKVDALENLKREPITVHLGDTSLLQARRQKSALLEEEIKSVRRAIHKAKGEELPEELRVYRSGC